MDKSFVILDSLFYSGLIVLVFPLWLLFSGFNRQPLVYKWLAIALGFAFAIDVIARVLWYMHVKWHIVHVNPNSTGHLYQLFGTALISVFFYHAIQWPHLKRYFFAVNILYFIFGLVNLLFLQKSSLHSYSQTLQSIIILFLCIIFYFKLLRELPTQQIQKLPLFWIVSGFFFSYSGKLVIYAITHYMIAMGNDFILISIFHVSLTLIAYLTMAVGVWLNYKQAAPEAINRSVN
jgi:hypothetical protein